MFKQTNMPGASAPTLSQVKIDTFLGADLTNSPDTATKVYIEQDLTCTNAQCANHGKIVEQRRAYLIGQA